MPSFQTCVHMKYRVLKKKKKKFLGSYKLYGLLVSWGLLSISLYYHQDKFINRCVYF